MVPRQAQGTKSGLNNRRRPGRACPKSSEDEIRNKLIQTVTTDGRPRNWSRSPSPGQRVSLQDEPCFVKNAEAVERKYDD